MHYLLKTEPGVYSFADLQREGTTVWDGVTNPVAVKNLRGMQPGDQLLIYHTGDEKQVVGSASVVSVDATDLRTPAVKIKAGPPLKKPVTLRLDADVLAWFKKKGRGYQTRINRALRGLMMEQRKESTE